MINNQFDVTITPYNGGFQMPAVTRMVPQGRMSFDQALAANRIYRGNGLICQRAMCQAITGNDAAMSCPQDPSWKRILEFCGPNATAGMAMDGMWWDLIPADGQQQQLATTKEMTGFCKLPTATNTFNGMYGNPPGSRMAYGSFDRRC